MVLLLFLEKRQIDLAQRLTSGALFTLSEIDALLQCCRVPLQALASETAHRYSSLQDQAVWISKRIKRKEVDPQSAAIRAIYIRNYLNWWVTGRLLRADLKSSERATLKIAAKACFDAINARIPASSGRNLVGGREGLSLEAAAALKEATSPQSSNNPWFSTHTRERNSLIINLLWGLGLRRGELLGLKISDINFRTNDILIARRADDPADPRENQPCTKTRDRLLPLGVDLARHVHSYVLGARRRIKGARNHEFLIVANGSGAPLTLIALNKIFVALRERCPELPKNLSPHMLRHTWNDDFSRVMDREKVGEHAEQRMRSYLMGWSETSKTAATYTRRHIREKAMLASVELQRSLSGGYKN